MSRHGVVYVRRKHRCPVNITIELGFIPKSIVFRTNNMIALMTARFLILKRLTSYSILMWPSQKKACTYLLMLNQHVY